MKKIIAIIIESIVFFFDHIGTPRDETRWDWQNRYCKDNRAKDKRKQRELDHIRHERFLKEAGRA